MGELCRGSFPWPAFHWVVSQRSVRGLVKFASHQVRVDNPTMLIPCMKREITCGYEGPTSARPCDKARHIPSEGLLKDAPDALGRCVEDMSSAYAT